MGRCLDLAHFEHGSGVANIANDRQAAEAGNGFAQQFEFLASSIGQLGRQASDVAARVRQARDHARSGSAATANTIGITDVACLTTRAAPPDVTMTSTLSLTNSAANSA